MFKFDVPRLKSLRDKTFFTVPNYMYMQTHVCVTFQFQETENMDFANCMQVYGWRKY